MTNTEREKLNTVLTTMQCILGSLSWYVPMSDNLRNQLDNELISLQEDMISQILVRDYGINYSVKYDSDRRKMVADSNIPWARSVVDTEILGHKVTILG